MEFYSSAICLPTSQAAGAGFLPTSNPLLEDERGLDGAVEELDNDLQVRLGHVPLGERGLANMDAAEPLGRGVP